MLDLETFYDSLDVVEIILRLNAMDFPALALLMHLQMHWAPRVIVAEGVASRIVLVARSVLAGSRSSNDVARAYLHPCLAEVHHKLPKVRLGTHADDVHMQLLGMAEHIVPMAVQALEVFREGIRGAQLQLNAGKSSVAASTMQVVAAVCRKAAADGFPLKPAISGRDLGVDCSAGSRRVLPIFQKRFLKASKKSLKIQVLRNIVNGKHKGGAARLWGGGVGFAYPGLWGCSWDVSQFHQADAG